MPYLVICPCCQAQVALNSPGECTVERGKLFVQCHHGDRFAIHPDVFAPRNHGRVVLDGGQPKPESQSRPLPFLPYASPFWVKATLVTVIATNLAATLILSLVEGLDETLGIAAMISLLPPIPLMVASSTFEMVTSGLIYWLLLIAPLALSQQWPAAVFVALQLALHAFVRAVIVVGSVFTYLG